MGNWQRVVFLEGEFCEFFWAFWSGLRGLGCVLGSYCVWACVFELILGGFFVVFQDFLEFEFLLIFGFRSTLNETRIKNAEDRLNRTNRHIGDLKNDLNQARRDFLNAEDTRPNINFDASRLS